ncbi:MAG: YicC family protein [Acidobacteria bacterium]|nr:MAG: YicC family protein [Acidobacteriota bacterium]
MLFSMTGFGEAQRETNDIRIAFRLRSVNNKGLDIQLKLPYDLSYLESAFRSQCKGKLFRGRIDVYVEFEVKNPELAPPVRMNPARLNQLLALSGQALATQKVQGRLDINTLVQMPDLFQEQRVGFKYPEHIDSIILNTFSDALDCLIESRAEEGAHLFKDIQSRVQTLHEEKNKVCLFVENRTENIKSAMLERLHKLNEDVGVDENRLTQELVFYADRLDVSEELTRLAAHIQTMKALLEAEKRPKGRELEFLLQEQFREVTTIGNKVKLIEAADRIVKLKTECEKIKEQVFNVE